MFHRREIELRQNVRSTFVLIVVKAVMPSRNRKKDQTEDHRESRRLVDLSFFLGFFSQYINTTFSSC